MNDTTKTGPVIIYDGCCHLCNGSIAFIIRRERRPILTFTPSQSEFASDLLKKGSLSDVAKQSIILFESGQVYTSSDVVVELGKYLKWPWSMLRYLGVLPKALRDPVYRVVANNRYRLFGKSDTCLVPDKSHRDRFIGL